MRKNKSMRVASLLLALTLITSCFVGGTFAKYVTDAQGTDTARVAKWGVTVQASGNLFGEHYYAKSDTAETSNKISASVQHSVDKEIALNGISQIVAPGTKSDKGLTLSVKGKPEVMYTVTYSNAIDATKNKEIPNEDIWLKAGSYAVMVKTTAVTEENYVGKYYLDDSNYVKAQSEEWTAVKDKTWYEINDETTVTANADGNYYPLKWTVTKETGSTGTLDTTEYRNVETMNTALKNEFSVSNVKAKIEVNDVYTISWEWAFEQKQDGADTILGHLMAKQDNLENLDREYEVVVKDNDNYKKATVDTDYNLEVAFGAEITVEQVD